MLWHSNLPNPHSRKPTLIALQNFAIHYGIANLEQEVRLSLTPAHMLPLARRKGKDARGRQRGAQGWS